nr:M1 family metallopeptidase [Tissierella sp.]
MKKINIFILLSLIILALAGCTSKDDGSKDINLQTKTIIDEDLNGLIVEDINHYKIDIKLDEKDKTYSGVQETRFKNKTGQPLKEIYFRLYPNAFKTLEGSPIVLEESRYTEKTFKEGYIDIESISVKGKDLAYKIEGVDDTVLKIKLDEDLMQDEEISIDMDYFVKLPTSQDRFGYGKDTMNFGNWYPVLSVHDEDGWSEDPYYSIGDPFYTDISDYDVNIRLDKDIIVASSGNIVEERVEDGEKIYKIEGKRLRDFAFSASREFKIREEERDGIVVRLYYLEEKEELIEASLKYAGDSIEVFNKSFGKYPYGVYSVVFTEFPSGMEYPGVVFIGKQFFNKDALEYMEQVIVHETAHQWWYGLVGNDEVKEAWLDEGLTSYSEVIYMDNIYGKEKGDEYFHYNMETGYEVMRDYLKVDDLTINKPVDKFQDWDDYGLLVYTKSAMFLRDIEDSYSEEILIKILEDYFQANKYKNASTIDFADSFEKVTGDSFKAMNDKWLK